MHTGCHPLACYMLHDAIVQWHLFSSPAEYNSSRIRKQGQFQYISFISPVDYEMLGPFYCFLKKKMETTGLWFYGTLEVEWNSNRHLNLTNSWHSFRIASSVLSFTQLHPHCKYPVNVLGMSKTVLSRPEGWRLPLGLSASRTISQETWFPETRQRSS